MSCKNPGAPLMLKDFDFNRPKGNTYEITISPHDRLIVTVQHPEFDHIKTVTMIHPIGITCGPEDNHSTFDDTGRIVYRTDFSIKSI